jgi:hypothetical protein
MNKALRSIEYMALTVAVLVQCWVTNCLKFAQVCEDARKARRPA